MFKRIMGAVTMVALLALSACSRPADVASHNLSVASDNFEVTRRVVFFNGITDSYLLSIEGLCSIDISTPKVLKVTCKTSASGYKKHYLGLSDNVTYFVEQMADIPINTYHYRVMFQPQTIIPEIDFRGSTSAIPLPGK